MGACERAHAGAGPMYERPADDAPTPYSHPHHARTCNKLGRWRRMARGTYTWHQVGARTPVRGWVACSATGEQPALAAHAVPHSLPVRSPAAALPTHGLAPKMLASANTKAEARPTDLQYLRQKPGVRSRPSCPTHGPGQCRSW